MHLQLHGNVAQHQICKDPVTYLTMLRKRLSRTFALHFVLAVETLRSTGGAKIQEQRFRMLRRDSETAGRRCKFEEEPPGALSNGTLSDSQTPFDSIHGLFVAGQGLLQVAVLWFQALSELFLRPLGSLFGRR